MKTDKVFFSEYAIFVCTKCQKSITARTADSAPATDIAESIKSQWKTEMNNMGLKGKVRVMTSSCLGVCPTGFQAVTQISMTNPNDSLSYVFSPFEEANQVLETIKKSVTK
ncbi:MAG: (2Fe-2S) ferredoxin domain-containing protein [Bdellovibrionaceae bacterium]|nr:(2Fe-2S) ferredoxin domain-containing protein [Pseudobdellovibrionaceae bacterium]